MDLCSGGSLTEWLKPENRPSEERVRQVGVRIADALAAVHAGGVLHRDVKPANILIDSFGNPRLADFALATVAGTETTAPDAVCSTPAYAPPEFGMQPATESGDVFSLAATLYALLAGRPPCDVGAVPVALEQTVEIAERPIGPIPKINRYLPIPGVNRHLMDVLITALSSDPVDRPTAARFRDQLANVPATSISTRGALVGAGDATRATSTPRSHSRPRRGCGYCDRTRGGLADQRARSSGPSGNDHVNRARRPTVIEHRSGHSIGESSRRRETLPNRSNPRYVPRWSRHLPAGAALGGRPVAGLPVTHRDRPGRPVHRLCRAWAAGSLPASPAGSRLRRDIHTL